jgi:hypothetical protein
MPLCLSLDWGLPLVVLLDPPLSLCRLAICDGLPAAAVAPCSPPLLTMPPDTATCCTNAFRYPCLSSRTKLVTTFRCNIGLHERCPNSPNHLCNPAHHVVGGWAAARKRRLPHCHDCHHRCCDVICPMADLVCHSLQACRISITRYMVCMRAHAFAGEEYWGG